MTNAPQTTGAYLFLFPLVLFGILLLIFSPTLAILLPIWNNDPNYSHGFLVIPISLWAGWRCYREAGSPPGGELFLGSLYILVGFVFHLAMLVVLWPPLDLFALLAILRGILAGLGGRAWANRFTFPLLFLFFMFPLPHGWTAGMALWLQEKVSLVSGDILGCFFTCWQHGTTIQIAGIPEPLFVGQECSGIRQTMAFLALGAFLGFFLKRPFGHRSLLLLAALPVAFIANVLRILLMALTLKYLGGDWIAGKFHDVPAYLTLPIGLGLYFCFDALLGNMKKK